MTPTDDGAAFSSEVVIGGKKAGVSLGVLGALRLDLSRFKLPVSA
jgi:hypothetical protein